jgi:hypothetical protein
LEGGVERVGTRYLNLKSWGGNPSQTVAVLEVNLGAHLFSASRCMARLLRSHQEGQLDAEPLCHCKSVHHQRAANAARTPSGFDRKSNLHRQKKGAP